MADDSRNVIPFRRKVIAALNALPDAEGKILAWPAEMRNAGLMPDDVQAAFVACFGNDGQLQG
jgi:hypothetical protein